jgi:hypothetical protein
VKSFASKLHGEWSESAMSALGPVEHPLLFRRDWGGAIGSHKPTSQDSLL